MNTRTKARLLRLAPRLVETVDTLAELKHLHDLEVSAATRHAKKGDGNFARHAEWSAAGLERVRASLMALDYEAAVATISAIHASRPSDSLPAWDETDDPDDPDNPDNLDPASVCGQGSCNHPEHL